MEEKALHEISKGCDYVSASEYNRNASQKDEYLCTCFDAPHDNVQYKLLSHNHVMLFLRAIMTNAQWSIDPIKQKEFEQIISPCDGQGKLCITAVAATENGKEFVEVIREGVECEVLSWKMAEEEPTAADIISAAFKKCSDLAMRTTEWSALYILKAHIIKAARTQDLNRVAYN